ncbi:MAG TPA: efflux RND transporter periplasmic adaptor subunit [Micropepsaceae bacterium]|nr:efflux RND transporter periplasmic adaptor subunit [Micropepsaceae bacterium]
MKRTITAGVALTLALSGALLVTVEQTSGTESKAAANAPIARDRLIAAGGLVEPASEARQLAASVVGRIVKMNFEEGDALAQGDVIAEVENDDLKAQAAGAEAAMAARASELARLKAGAREQEIAAAKAELREAEAVAANAQSSFERRVALGTKQIVSKEVVDQARADRDTAEARRDFLAQKLSLLVAPPRSEDVAIAQANLDAARARLAEIRAEIEKTIVRSPINGVVLKLYRRAGETVSNLPPTPVAMVGDISRLRVRADIEEADVAAIAPGQTVWVTADAYPNKRFRGTVGQIGVQLGRKNFRNDNPEERLDTKILEAMIDLEPGVQLPIGLPVDIKADPSSKNQKLADARAATPHDTETVFKQSFER